MLTLAIDTNTYVAFLNGNKDVVDYVRRADEIIIPFIVLGELYHGFYRGNKAPENIRLLEEFLDSPRVSIAQSDVQSALIFGEIATELADKGKPMQQDDIWIAALCKRNNYSLLTLDQGFKNIIGLKLLPISG